MAPAGNSSAIAIAAASVARDRRSIERAVVVPILLVGTLLAAAGAWRTYSGVSHALRERALEQADTLANAVKHVAETVQHADLERLVVVLGGEPDVDLIVGVGGDPPRVLAATPDAWIGRRVEELPDAALRRHLDEALRTRRPHRVAPTGGATLELVSPVLVDREHAADPQRALGAVAVRLDTRQATREATIAAARATAWGVAAVLLVAALTSLLVHARIVRPLAAIRSAMNRRAEGDADAFAPTDGSGEIGSLAGTLNEMIEAIAESELRFRQLAEAVDDVFAIVELDRGIRCSYVSPAVEKVYGFEPAVIMDDPSHMLEVVHPSDRDRLIAISSLWLQAPLCIEFRIRRPDGKVRWIRSRSFPVHEPSGLPARRLAVVATDITERRESEESLRGYAGELERTKAKLEANARELQTLVHEVSRTRDAALAATRAKSDFLATMSHEIRTPMNGVIGMASLLLGSPLGPEQREQAQAIHSSGEHLLAIINDILDFSKVEAGKMTLAPSEIDLRRTLAEVVDLLAPQARAKRLTLDLLCDDSVPGTVVGDAGRIRQIVMNLLGNAFKFTDEGGVAIRVTCLQRHDGVARLRIAVADTGIGIPADRVPALFREFSQGDPSTTRRFGGTGLGLAISKRLAEMMGGEIGVESAPGRGSTFWFTMQLPVGATSVSPAALPPPDAARGEGSAAVASAPRAPETPPPDVASFGGPPADREGAPARDPHRAHVLVVDDNAINQRVACRMLQRLGCRVGVADNGREAVDLTLRESFDLVLMDCQMPEMDGYEATRRIRGTTGGARGVPIVAMTANAMAGDRDRCLAAGMDDYLAKPVRLEQLEAVLERWVAGRGPSPGDAGAPDPAPAATAAGPNPAA